MRVLHLLASPWFSGPAEVVTELARAQRALGHDVAVAVDRLRASKASEELAVPRLLSMGLLDEHGLELSVKSSPFGLWRDLQRLKVLEVDVVHCHMSHDHTLAWLSRPSGARVIRSLHAPRSIRWSTPKADGWTVPVDAWARRLLGARVVVLPPIVGANFVPPGDRAAHQRALGLPVAPLVGMVSTFQASRRHDVGLAAFARLLEREPEARLVLVGDGREERAVRSRIAALGLDGHVHLVGYQSGARFVEFLQALDEVWILGLGNDFSGRAAAQARACGVRVVAVDEGALARYADAVVSCEGEGIAEVALRKVRRSVLLESSQAVASRVIDLYGQVPILRPK